MNILSAKFKLALDEFILKVDIDIPVHGFTVLFGPSGSGKTSLARTIAGLEPSASGLVRFRETIWQDSKQKVFIPTHERRVGFVFHIFRYLAGSWRSCIAAGHTNAGH